jgi:peptide/nickel transport system ATP-binding protein
MSTDKLLEIDDLTVQYRGDVRTTTAVDHVSFGIAPGEIFGLAGESGCGKSTIANTILRLLKYPAEVAGGRILFDGRDVLALNGEDLRQFRWREVAMVFQSAMNSLNPVLTIGEQMRDIFTSHLSVTRREADARSAKLLEMVQIDRGRLRSFPHQLSGGMRQRVVIAMAVAPRPRMLILDEPTTALDVVVQQEIMAEIKALQAELGFSVLFITHDMSLMVEISHQMAVMYAGRIVEQGPANSLHHQPAHAYTRALMNAFPPITGPRVPLRGLGEGVRLTRIGDLQPVGHNHWAAPVSDEDRRRLTPLNSGVEGDPR